ncbi:M1 family metalloprotease [Flavobacterium saliperosum S13]|uniref:Aminopeptidase N n=2 Tax=Flavobacterium saliperosum TaxID=329186 RepID=A0A1G4W860_9FLAO|nr:M1 family metallopeptidase [Flavobacterium saliperosum]ESU24675.1 M1 family metalloprotease [Flavobacterium saliperosum S13]SCX18308.1 aminopeptidase N [Flavobacterium saliperosum]
MKYIFLFITSFVFAQQTKKVDFISLNAHLTPNAIEKSVTGKVVYDFVVKSKIDTIKIDAVRMEFSEMKINGKAVPFKNSGKSLKIYKGFKKGKNKLEFSYSAQPKQTMYFVGDASNGQIWTQGQGKYTSHWLPSFDDVNEKVIFNVSVDFRNDFDVLSNGVLKNVGYNSKENIKTWNYQMQQPMSSYLVMLAIGKFVKQTEITASGTPLEFYLREEDASKFATTYKYSKEIFDFFEREIGVKYPWEVYRQVPVMDFLYAGMENTSATIFAQDFVVDEIGFNDRTYVNVNAHELAHQWFGDMITAQSGKHHWLQEGFATYYALLAEKELFGEDHFNFELYQTAETLQRASKNDTIPLMNEKASSLTFYQKGAWALHYLRRNIGEENFRKAVKNYLNNYGFKNVNTDDFLAEVNKVSKFDTNAFKKVWLEQSGFEVQEALAILKKNKFISDYLALTEQFETPFSEKQKQFETIFGSDAFYPLKEEVIYQLQEVPFEEKKELLVKAMQTNNLKVRQAIAVTMKQIPLDFKSEYSTLLNDASYLTREMAFKNLMAQFPENRISLLDKTKDWVGFNDKNLRVAWLTMALATKDYQNENKVTFYDELLTYSTPKFEANTRQNAIVNLLFLNKADKNVLPNLVNGLTHYKWQFTKFCREQIREMVKQDTFKKYFEELLPTLPEREKVQLQKLL